MRSAQLCGRPLCPFEYTCSLELPAAFEALRDHVGVSYLTQLRDSGRSDKCNDTLQKMQQTSRSCS